MKLESPCLRNGVALLASALAVACGGGDEPTRVSNLALTNTMFGKTMTVSVAGSGLDDPDLTLETQGVPCSGVARGTALEYQTSFSCLVEGTGTIVAVIRNGAGADLGRVEAPVPVPEVMMMVTQGARSGSFVVELDPAAAPVTALNFVRYVNRGFYAQTIFHRVLAGQIVQGGQYLTDKSIRAPLFDPIPLESDNGLKNLRGTIAMARTSVPDSASAQFYLNLRDNPAFDYVGEALPGYAVFGRVVSGMEVVDETAKVPIYTFDNTLPALPQQDVVITLAVQTK